MTARAAARSHDVVAPTLVVNADDLGYDPEIDRGILEAHRRGLVSSASAMVDTPFAARALAEAPASLGVGLHAVLPPGQGAEAAAASVDRQLERFERLRGAPPTHLDAHRHAHAAPEVLEALARLAAPRRLPVRALDAAMRAFLRARGVPVADHLLGDASLRPCWNLERLLGVLGALPEGTSELMCHPGYAPAVTRTSFGAEREIELRALVDPRSLEALRRSGARLSRFDGRPEWGPFRP